MFAVTVAAARQLTQSAFGVFALASTAGWMLAVATDFGIELHVARSIAAKPAGAGADLRRWLRVRVWLSVWALFATGAAVAVMRPHPVEAIGILLIAAAYLAGSLLEFFYYVFRGLGRSDVESTVVLAHRGALLVCALTVLAWRPSLALLGAAMLVPAAAALAATARIAMRLVSSQETRGSGSFAVTPGRSTAVGREFARDVAPIGAGVVLSALYFRIDLFFVAAWNGTAAAGLYNAAFRMVEALRLFPAAVVAVVLPAIFRARTRRTLVEVGAALTAFGAVAGAVGIATAGWIVPLLFGPSYEPAIPAFRILMLSFPLLSLNYALTHQLVGWHGERAWAATCAAALAANVALDIWLIPAGGIAGAAWATLWTEVVLALGCMVKLRSLVPGPAAVASAASS